MKLVDVNILVHAVNQGAPEHARVREWLEDEINASNEIGMPWVALLGFVRLSINPKVMPLPLTLEQALDQVFEWLALPNVSIPAPSIGHHALFAANCKAANAKHPLITDAHLATLAQEHDATMVSCDTDFSKFPGLLWMNPLAR